MKLKILPIMLASVLLGCGNPADKYSDREDSYNRSLECYQTREESEDCNLAYRSLMDIERRGLGEGGVEKYKEKYCSGLRMDELLCDIGKAIAFTEERREADRAEARVDYYLSNRSELQKTYNNCGDAYYKKAGLTRDESWIGASGLSKFYKARKTFSEEFNWECDAAAEAANKLNIEHADSFVNIL